MNTASAYTIEDINENRPALARSFVARAMGHAGLTRGEVYLLARELGWARGAALVAAEDAAKVAGRD